MKKKAFFLCLSVLLPVIVFLSSRAFAQQQIVVSGETSNRVMWKITADGTLTISGSSDSYKSPWQEYSRIIKYIVVEDGITGIPDNSFSMLGNLSGVYLGSTVKWIGKSAFSMCPDLQSITLPDSLTRIDDYAFRECKKLKKIHFTPECRLQSIGSYAFSQTAITELTTPACLKEIDEGAFSGCQSLTYLKLTNGLERVYGNAFENCTNLQEVYIAESVNLTGSNAFKNCMMIRHIEVYTNHFSFSLDNQIYLKTAVIAGNRTWIHAFFFDGCTSLTDVTLGPSVTEIQGDAFQGCSSLTSLTLPGNLKTIGTHAFRNSGIQKLVIPETLTTIQMFAFENCKLQEIVFTGNAPVVQNQSCFSGVTATARYPADNPTWNKDTLLPYGGNITWVPTSCNGNHMEAVTPGLSVSCYNSGLTEGKHCAVCGEVLLAQEAVPSPGHSFGPWILCESPTLYYEGVEDRTCTVCGATELKTIPRLGLYEQLTPPANACGENLTWQLQDNVLTISGSGPMTVYDQGQQPPWAASAASVTRLVVEEGVTFLSCRAFQGFSELTQVSLPATLHTIGRQAFLDCAKLTAITLPEGLQFLMNGAFQNTGLQSITIPKTIKLIDAEAFLHCAALKQIRFIGDAPSVSLVSFTGVNATVDYPAGNPTWTKKMLYSYGGTLTWVGYCEAEHSYSPWTETKAPTAEEAGLAERTCTFCGATEQKELEKLPPPVTDPTEATHPQKTEPSDSTEPPGVSPQTPTETPWLTVALCILIGLTALGGTGYLFLTKRKP